MPAEVFEVDDLVKMLAPDRDRETVIPQLHAAATRQRDRMLGTPEGDARDAQALILGRLWGAADLSRRMVVWGETREIIPPRPRRADEPLNEHKHGTEWVVSAALSWPAHAVDVLDRELFGLAVGGEDDRARSYGWRMRGALEVALAWRTAALVSDRYDVPVTRPDVDVDDLRGKIAAWLGEAEGDGLSMQAGAADSVGDRLRAADMATGRAQAYRRILSMLDRAPRYQVDSDEEGCEGCGEVAVTRDSEGVPLCAACYDDLPLLDPGADPDAGGDLVITPRKEDGHAL